MLSRPLWVWLAFAIAGVVWSADVESWETYLNTGSAKRPFGLIINETSIAHEHFLVGHSCLHTFLYDSAKEAFDLAIKTDPTFVEAHIGRLFGHKHALWGYTDRNGALKAWQDSWSTFDQYSLALTPLQFAYFNATFQWFAYANVHQGETTFLAAMNDLVTKYPSENDAKTLLGLAYLNEASQELEKSDTTETSKILKSREILQDVFAREPTHPGCLHYLVHAFDVPEPVIAVKGVPYAYKMNEVSPTTSHAVHMPSHIWNRIGRWSLAQSANARSVQVHLRLCTLKHKTFFSEDDPILQTSVLTLRDILASVNQEQVQVLLDCDQSNRLHSQDWLVYAYMQTGQYNASVGVLTDLLLSYDLSLFDSAYLPLIHRARACLVIETFFWLMYNREKYQAQFISSTDRIGLRTDPSSIRPGSDPLSEALVRFAVCLRLLAVERMDSVAVVSFNYHLIKINQLATNRFVRGSSIATRISLLALQIQALRRCSEGEVIKCLEELQTATEMESSLIKDFDGPEIVYLRSGELFAFYLLLVHKSYTTPPIASSSEFPSMAFDLYQKLNGTFPDRGNNLLGMARAQAQMGHRDEASELYEKILRLWSHSSDPSSLDRIVIEEANEYLY